MSRKIAVGGTRERASSEFAAPTAILQRKKGGSPGVFVKPGAAALEAVTWGSTLLPKIEPALGWYPGNRPAVFLLHFPLYPFTKVASWPGPTRNWQGIRELRLFICIFYCILIFVLQMAVSTLATSGLMGLTVNPRARALGL